MAGLRTIKEVVIPNIKYLLGTRLGVCGCCQKASVIISLSQGEETKICLRCKANFRYQMLGTALHQLNLTGKSILDLDPKSPLKNQHQGQVASYKVTYYSTQDALGSQRSDGAFCEDLTQLTLADESLDYIISSDVLEHIPDLKKAFSESYRVLRKGGAHLFTVPAFEVEYLKGAKFETHPFKGATLQRAEIDANGNIHHFAKPEYHGDQLAANGGILAFWTFGDDAVDFFNKLSPLKVSILLGPTGYDQRMVFQALKV